MRDPRASKQLLDLTRFYNAMLTESWHGGNDNTLEGLLAGVQKLGGVEFDVRGVVQLGCNTSTNWPMEIKGIQVQQKCQRIHFLHSAAWGRSAEEGKPIASYVVHFATNNMRLEIPIIYGQSIRDWHSWASEPAMTKEMTVAWKGENGVSRRAAASIRLFKTPWINLLPDVPIESIDLVSAHANAAPFVVAFSVE